MNDRIVRVLRIIYGKVLSTIMQSVNIHIIKIFNKTCRLGNQNIGLNLYIFKTFFLLCSPFFSSLFPTPTRSVKQLQEKSRKLGRDLCLAPVLQP